MVAVRKTRASRTLETPVARAVALASVPLVPSGDVVVGQKTLRDALQRMQTVADRKSTIPMLSHVALRSHASGIVMCATDLDVSLTVHVGATGSLPSGVAVPAKAWLDITKLLPGDEVGIARSEHGITLTSHRVTNRIAGLPDRDFPKIPCADGVAFATIPAEPLVEMIDSTLFSVCLDETRFHLNGALIEGTGSVVRVITTDGHRLTVASRPIAGLTRTGVIVPRKGLLEIKRLLGTGTCDVGFSERHMFVRHSGMELAIKMIDAQFPPYEQVIPKGNSFVATVARVPLLDAFRRARLLTSETRGVRIEIQGMDLVLASDNPDTGDMVERVGLLSGHDHPVKTGCNAVYAIEALSHIGDDHVTIAFSRNALDPFMVRPAGDVALGDLVEILCVIMPMRS